MNKDKIANIIYNELSYMYCDNCRYATELSNDPDTDFSPCDDCHRKYNSWGISMTEAERIAEMIRGVENEKRHDDAVSENGTLTVCVSNGSKVERVLVLGDDHYGGLYYADGGDEHWIPVDDDGAAPDYKVICQDEYENMMLGYAWIDEYGIWVCEDDNVMMDDVIAWKPLPKPYKESEDMQEEKIE